MSLEMHVLRSMINNNSNFVVKMGTVGADTMLTQEKYKI